MTTNAFAYALLVGVNDYRAFDATGRADLAGPVRDVTAWWAIARQLGVPAENIRVCTAPVLSARALGAGGKAATRTGASHNDLVAALTWLAEKLNGTHGTKALFTWSGHGTQIRDEAVLCPSDVKGVGGKLLNGLTAKEVGALIDKRAEKTRITAFIDACHTDTGFTGNLSGRGLPWAPATKIKAKADAVPPHRALGDLVLTSSQHGAPSFELPVIGGVRGAFSWATSSLIQRYGLADAKGGATGRLSFADLATAAGAVLEAMAVPQAPRYVGDEKGAALRVFSTFGDKAVGSLAPQALDRVEIWPGVPDGKVRKSKLWQTSSKKLRLGTMYLTGSNPPSGWAANTEYWHWNDGGKWPTRDFYAEAPSKTKDSVSTSNTTTYAAGSLTKNSKSVTIPAGAFAVATSSSGTTLGYVYATSSAFQVWSVTSPAPSTLLSSDGAVWFTYQSAAISDVNVTAEADES